MALDPTTSSPAPASPAPPIPKLEPSEKLLSKVLIPVASVSVLAVVFLLLWMWWKQPARRTGEPNGDPAGFDDMGMVGPGQDDHYRKTDSCRVSRSLPSARPRALGKDVLCRVPRLSAKSLPSVRNPTLGKKIPLPRRLCRVAFAECNTGKEFAECKLVFAECNRHSAKPVNPVVYIHDSLIFCASKPFVASYKTTKKRASYN